ncbi:MAG: class I lanthipeptide [Hyphomicrobiales bacterium]
MKKLHFKKETVATLNNQELNGIHGGKPITWTINRTEGCDENTIYCPSINKFCMDLSLFDICLEPH